MIHNLVPDSWGLNAPKNLNTQSYPLPFIRQYVIRRFRSFCYCLFVFFPPRSPRVRRSRRVHPSAVRSQEQIDYQRDLLSYDVCNGHEQHTVRIRCRHWRHHCQQSQRMRTILDHDTPYYAASRNNSWQTWKGWGCFSF